MSRLKREYFEDLYAASEDPWKFATSDYEREKYERTLQALGGRRFGKALEAGCSIGVFTSKLAPHCGELLAIDASRKAIVLARERLSGTPGVRVERRTLPEEMPDEPFDLIVVSEILYYLDRPTMIAALGKLEGALASGGSLLAVHWRRETKTYPLQGDEVHELIFSNTRLVRTREEATPDYRLELYEDTKDGGHE